MKIIESLTTNTTLTELDLQGYNRLRKIFKQSIVIMKLKDNCIGDEGEKRINELLMTNSTLTKLNLETHWTIVTVKDN